MILYKWVQPKHLITRQNIMADTNAKPIPTEAAVREQLKNIIDPEFGVDIVNLGLVYDIIIKGKSVEIHFTLTMPSCPLEEQFRREMTFVVTNNFEIDSLTLTTVWFPRWSEEFLTEEARFMCGLPI
jgi:metal-sulfur cluster biosynthetic enzyme